MRDGADGFRTTLALSLKPSMYADRSSSSGFDLHVVLRGIVIKDARIITRGQVWGTDVILTASKLRQLEPARTLTYVQLYSISADELGAILNAHPSRARRCAPRAALWMALRRGLLWFAREMQATSEAIVEIVRAARRRASTRAATSPSTTRRLGRPRLLRVPARARARLRARRRRAAAAARALRRRRVGPHLVRGVLPVVGREELRARSEPARREALDRVGAPGRERGGRRVAAQRREAVARELRASSASSSAGRCGASAASSSAGRCGASASASSAGRFRLRRGGEPMPSGATRRQKAGSRQLAAAKASSGIGRRSGGPARGAAAAPWRRAPRGRAARRRAAAAAVGVVGDRRAPAGGRAGAGAAGPEDEGAQRDGREGLAHGAGVERRVCGRGAADDAAQEGEPPRGGHARACGQTSQTRTLAKKGSYAGADPAPVASSGPHSRDSASLLRSWESTVARQLIEVSHHRARLARGG